MSQTIRGVYKNWSISGVMRRLFYLLAGLSLGLLLLCLACVTAGFPNRTGYPMCAPPQDTTRWVFSRWDLDIEHTFPADIGPPRLPDIDTWVFYVGTWEELSQIPIRLADASRAFKNARLVGYLNVRLDRLSVVLAIIPAVAGILILQRPGLGRLRRWMYDGVTLLSMLLCALYGFLALSWDRLWIEGQVAIINGTDQIIHDFYSLGEAKNCLAACITFSILPLFRGSARVLHHWRDYRGGLHRVG